MANLPLQYSEFGKENSKINKSVKKILIDHPKTNIILLDDGFQHRSIKRDRKNRNHC